MISYSSRSGGGRRKSFNPSRRRPSPFLCSPPSGSPRTKTKVAYGRLENKSFCRYYMGPGQSPGMLGSRHRKGYEWPVTILYDTSGVFSRWPETFLPHRRVSIFETKAAHGLIFCPDLMSLRVRSKIFFHFQGFRKLCHECIFISIRSFEHMSNFGYESVPYLAPLEFPHSSGPRPL